MNTTTNTALAPDQPELLAELRVPPHVSWPAVTLMLVAYAMFISSWVLCLMGEMPFWLGMAINSVAAYLQFTPAHDSIHRAASRYPWLNELILRAATFIAIPFGSGQILRLMHMRHHRFTNEENDPDHTLASSLKLIPLWGFWPFLYVFQYFKDPSILPSLKVNEVRRELLIALVFIVGFTLWIPEAMFWLWWLPTYFGFFLMCLVFMVLPHYPHAVRESDNPWRASLMRLGHEWFLTPVLMYQNYHLMHHLYPTVPFYRYGKAWRARQQYHLENNPGIVPAFGLGAKDGAHGEKTQQAQ
ncbi:MAG: fatty acid desaturase [Pedobacter sp.]|nr:fatty acid desaturase [Pedobacter sp.]